MRYFFGLLWGISSTKHTLSSLSDVVEVLYALLETEDIKLDIKVHDYLPNDEEADDNKWYTSITVYGNDPKYKHNASLCNIITKTKNDFTDLESYAVSKEMYDLAKEKTKEYYTLPLKQKKFPEISREERMKKHLKYMNLPNKKN